MADEKKMPEFVTIEDRNGNRCFAQALEHDRRTVLARTADGATFRFNRYNGGFLEANRSVHNDGWHIIGSDVKRIQADEPKHRDAHGAVGAGDAQQAMPRAYYAEIRSDAGGVDMVTIVSRGDKTIIAKDHAGNHLAFRRSDGQYIGHDDERKGKGWRIGEAALAKIYEYGTTATPEQCAAQRQAGVDRVTQTVSIDVSADVAERIDDLKKEVDAAIVEAKEASGSAAVVFADVFASALKDPPKQAATSMAMDFGVSKAGKYADDVVAELRKHNALHAAAEMVVARLGLASDNVAAWRAQRDAGDAEPIYNITLIANSAEGGKAAAEAFVRRMHEWQEQRCAAG